MLEPIKITTSVKLRLKRLMNSLFSKLIFIVPDAYNEESKEEWQILSAADYVCIEVDHTTPSAALIIFLEGRFY